MNDHDYDITYTAGGAVPRRHGYFGMTPRPEERPPADRQAVKNAPPFLLEEHPVPEFRWLPGRLLHLRDGERAELHGTMTGRLPDSAVPWRHGVPPLRAAMASGRPPTEGKRQFDDIYLAESEDYAGDIAVHFARGTHETVVELAVADFLNLQAAVTDPQRPVTRRQVAEYLRALREGWDPADAAAMHRVMALLEETDGDSKR